MFNVVGPAGHIAFSVARGETFSAGDWIWVELRDGKPFRVHYLGTDGVPFAGQEMDAPTVPVVSVENPLDKYRNAVRDYEETTLSPGAAASGGSGTQGSVKPDAQLKAKVTLDQVEKAARAKAAAKATSDTRARKDAEETKERARRDELDRIHADAVAASKPKMVYQVVDCKSFTPESLLFAACNSVDVDTWQRCTRTGQWNSADPSCSVN
jgi:hypothetical protein